MGQKLFGLVVVVEEYSEQPKQAHEKRSVQIRLSEPGHAENLFTPSQAETNSSSALTG